MFLDLFYGLRDEGVNVAIQEWQMFMTALERGLHDTSLLSFYNLARAPPSSRARPTSTPSIASSRASFTASRAS